MQPNGTQKRTGRYKYICRFGERTVEEVMAEVKDRIKKYFFMTLIKLYVLKINVMFIINLGIY